MCSKLWWLGVIALTISAFVPQISTSQVGWIHSDQRNIFSLEAWKASFTEKSYYTFMTSVWFLSGNIPVSKSLALVMDIPFAHLSYTSQQYKYWSGSHPSEDAYGNPYFGLEYARDSGSTPLLKAGIRFPLARTGFEEVNALGVISAFDRFEAFTPKVLSINASTGYRYMAPGGLTLRGSIGPTAMFPAMGDPEVWADFTGMIWGKVSALSVGAGLSGRLFVGGPHATELSFGERLVDQMVFALNADFGEFRPGIHFLLPLDQDMRQSLSIVYGISLSIHPK